MAEKKYKRGTKKYVVGTDGYKRDRKTMNKNQWEYKQKTYQAFTFRVRKDDEIVIGKLESVPNKTEYILNLIREDLKNG